MDYCMLERVKDGKIVVVNTETAKEYIEKVLRLNGVLEYRYWGDKGVYTYTPALNRK